MEEHKVPINEESKAETLHTPELSRKYYTLENEIIGQLRDVLIMYKLRTEKSHTVPMYKFDENREIVNYSNAFMKDPLRITEDTRNIYILKIYRSFLRLLKQEELPDTIREKYQQSIKNFIKTNFSLPHKQFEKHPFEKHLPLQEAWKLYQNRFKNKEITGLEKNIYMIITNLLYHKNHHFLEENGNLSLKGLKYLAQLFYQTIHTVSDSGTSKAPYKIFHDGDFGFLYTKGPNNKVSIAQPCHYVEAIKYLMDTNGFNAYGEGGEKGNAERNKSKLACLNDLYLKSKTYTGDSQENQIPSVSSREQFHQETMNIWEQAVGNINQKQHSNTCTIVASGRPKSPNSIGMKQGSGKSTTLDDITDLSGLRATFYGDITTQTQAIENTIITTMKAYRAGLGKEGITITKIELDKKGKLVSDEVIKHIQNELPNAQKRKNKAEKFPALEVVQERYKKLSGKTLPSELVVGYETVKGSNRGTNGDYNDFKFIIQLEKADGSTLNQEISFYHCDNDVDLGNHHILDLEKIIHSIVNKRSEKIISLNNIRRQTEKKIKEMSFDIDRYEQDIRDGKVPSPQNDNYAYMRANGQKISLKDLRYRNEKNTERFNSLICHIINHFIQQKKLLCMIKKGEPFNNLFTTPEIIKDRKIAKEIGFTTTDVLPYISHDTKFEDYDLGIYGTPVTRCPMAELGKVLTQCVLLV